jgi:hypothetical protein
MYFYLFFNQVYLPSILVPSVLLFFYFLSVYLPSIIVTHVFLFFFYQVYLPSILVTHVFLFFWFFTKYIYPVFLLPMYSYFFGFLPSIFTQYSLFRMVCCLPLPFSHVCIFFFVVAASTREQNFM